MVNARMDLQIKNTVANAKRATQDMPVINVRTNSYCSVNLLSHGPLKILQLVVYVKALYIQLQDNMQLK